MILLIAEYTLRSILLGLLAWLTLQLLRIRAPRAERAVWRIVLITALLMPVLLQLGTLSPVRPPTTASYVQLVSLPIAASASLWQMALLGVLVAISGALVVRHCIGIARCWAVGQRAERMSTTGHDQLDIRQLDIRMSSEVSSPATVFSTVLVPTDFASWSPATQRLAIAHERSHVAGRDFYVQWLAHLYRNLFWFNPFAWWLANRLSLLNEHVSDDAALDGRDERTFYAKVLLDLAQGNRISDQLVPMVRAHSLGARVERILRPSSPDRIGAHTTLLAACLLSPILATTAALPSAQVVLPKSVPNKPLSYPAYPPHSRRLGEHGTVVLKLHVLEDGSVADAVIDESSGYPDLDYSAFYESFRWQLDPGTIDGAPARMWGRFAVTFKLSDS